MQQTPHSRDAECATAYETFLALMWQTIGSGGKRLVPDYLRRSNAFLTCILFKNIYTLKWRSLFDFFSILKTIAPGSNFLAIFFVQFSCKPICASVQLLCSSFLSPSSEAQLACLRRWYYQYPLLPCWGAFSRCPPNSVERR